MRVSFKRHIVWGVIVGVMTAIAYNLVLWFQFDAEVSIAFLVASLPICAAVGAIVGWAWWQVIDRR